MTEKKVILIISVLTVLTLVGGIFLLTRSNTTATSAQTAIAKSESAKANVDQSNFDWGTINMNNGNVEKIFNIKNSGTDVLKLTRVRTSCHCTKAYITINGVTSPGFGMSPSFSWVGDVTPSGEAELKVVFDPAYHGPNGVGPVTRYISVETNDAKNPNLEFTLTANVTK